MFGRATIRLGIGPHSSLIITFHVSRIDHEKCIVVTLFCVSVCLSVRGRMPTLLHGPGCNLGSGRDAL